MVFLHGNPGFSLDWEDLSERVNIFARTIASDMPGFGNADKPEKFDYTVDGYARHLDGVLKKLGVRRTHLVLHDFGGVWGLAWGGGAPSRGYELDTDQHRCARVSAKKRRVSAKTGGESVQNGGSLFDTT